MANTLRFWSGAIAKIRQSNPHPLGFFVLLVLLTIPLGYAVNSISLGLLAAATLWNFKKLKFRPSFPLILPVLFYVLMALSLAWTIDFELSSEALVKQLPLLVIPLIFLFAPAFDTRETRHILRNFASVMALYACYWLLAAIVRFVLTGDANVFFYHELVTLDLNAVHVSVYAAVAFFILQSREIKPFWVRPALWILALLILLLSSKNIIVVFGLLLAFKMFYKKQTLRKAWIWIGFAMLVAASALRNRATLSRAASKASVVSLARVCRPRWTLA